MNGKLKKKSDQEKESSRNVGNEEHHTSNLRNHWKPQQITSSERNKFWTWTQNLLRNAMPPPKKRIKISFENFGIPLSEKLIQILQIPNAEERVKRIQLNKSWKCPQHQELYWHPGTRAEVQRIPHNRNRERASSRYSIVKVLKVQVKELKVTRGKYCHS